MAKQKPEVEQTDNSKRKTPQRNPIRKLYMEKSRLEFERDVLNGKEHAERERHSDALTTINDKRAANVTRLAEIEAELANPKQELTLTGDSTPHA